jgi:outer membrane lipoprotein-sorting protein
MISPKGYHTLFLKEQMLKNLLCPVAFLCAFFIGNVLYASPLKTLSLDFTRELTENNKTESITGALHYDVQAARVVVEVIQPLKQIMVVKNNVLEIYYPVEKQAFRFTSEGRVPLPFVESIIQSTQAEYGLTAIGYTLDRHDVMDETLYTYWAPPKEAKDKLGPVILGMRDDRLISAEVKNPKGHIIARSRYQKHSKIGANYIPMTVTSSTYDEKSEMLQHEQIVYSNLLPNADPPNAMLNFTIPESVEVKEIKW